MTERVELELGDATARYLRGCAQQRGVPVAAAAARLLDKLAVAAAAADTIRSFEEHAPTYFEDMEAERIEAFTG